MNEQELDAALALFDLIQSENDSQLEEIATILKSMTNDYYRGEISQDEFKELLEDVTSLEQMEYRRIEHASKMQLEKLKHALLDLALTVI